jgi:hypothetical protein
VILGSFRGGLDFDEEEATGLEFEEEGFEMISFAALLA